MSQQKTALILGVGGQDGSYLAELLLEKGYHVHGFYRRSSVDNLARLTPFVRSRVTLHKGDLAEPLTVRRAVAVSAPDEIYNLADQDHVGWSYAVPGYNMDVTARAVMNLLEIVKDAAPCARLFQPVSATIFGDAPAPQNEETPTNPQSPYAIAKAACLAACRYYRIYHGLWVSCGIMYNHDSPRRQGDYLLHKIARTAVEIARGKADKMVLGCLKQQVDIGWAPEYVDAMWRMLQHREPDDFVIGSGVGWEIGRIADSARLSAGCGTAPIEVDPAFARPGDSCLIADSYKAFHHLEWVSKCGAVAAVNRLVSHYEGVIK